jgi:hypothetical protein
VILLPHLVDGFAKLHCEVQNSKNDLKTECIF